MIILGQWGGLAVWKFPRESGLFHSALPAPDVIPVGRVVIRGQGGPWRPWTSDLDLTWEPVKAAQPGLPLAICLVVTRLPR